MIRGHGGNVHEAARLLGCNVAEIVDASSNLNPLGPVPGLFTYLARRITEAISLPEPDAQSAVRHVARWMGLSPKNLTMGNGTTQFIYAIPQALRIRNALVMAPTYADYQDACALVGVPVRCSFLDTARKFVPDLEKIRRKVRAVDVVFFCNPNNPTGVFTPSDTLADLVRSCPETLFVIDESYLPFCGPEKALSLAQQALPNALILMSLSKMYALAGLRVGFVHGPLEITEKLRSWCPPWSVNTLAAMAVEYLAENQDAAFAHAKETRAFCTHERDLWLKCFANDDRVRFYPGAATFLLGELATGEAVALCEHLRRCHILVRDCSNFAGLSPAWFRVSMKGAEENIRLRWELGEWLQATQTSANSQTKKHKQHGQSTF